MGLDYSDAFIGAAEHLRTEKSLRYQRWETGRHNTDLTAKVDPAIDCNQLGFVQGDAANLDAVPLLQNNVSLRCDSAQ
jgi:hypothetical protein